MFVDARTLSSGSSLAADVCIIGGGVAGITMAVKLAAQGATVCIVEGGGFKFSHASQALYDGQVEGHDYDLLRTRTRYLGGSSNCWGGWCQPLAETDFKQRPWISHAGWPFGLAALAEHYERAGRILELGDWNDRDAWNLRMQQVRHRLFPFDESYLTTLVSPLSPPTRFGIRYRKDLARSANVTVYLNANAVEVETDGEGRCACCVRVKTLTGVELQVKAATFVLAAGGIENARLLLLSNRVQTNGLGNGYGNVGRYFMDHPRLRTGRVFLTSPSTFRRLYDSTYFHRNALLKARGAMFGACLALSEAVLEEEGLLQVHTGLNACYMGEEHPGVEHAKLVYKAFTSAPLAPLSRSAITGTIRGLPAAMTAYLGRATRLNRLVRYFRLEAVVEPQPDPLNRVTLLAERDALGVNKVHVRWRAGDLERRSHKRAMQIIAAQIAARGLGRVELEPEDWEDRWESKVLTTWHHMGTTRMNPNPRLGVVDENCRVHGTDNVYIAGSSVFPGGTGHPPTLTIVALALRLAEHIAARRMTA